MMNDLKLDKTELYVFLTAFAIALIAKGAILSPLEYGIDDYQWISYADHDHRHFYQFFLEMSRFGWIPVMEILHWIGASPPSTNIFFGVIIFSAMAMTGVLTCRMFGISQDYILSAIVASLIIVHPYQAETFTARYTVILVALYFFLGVLAIYWSKMDRRTLMITSTCFMFAVSIYQLVVNMALVILCFAVILEMARRISEGSRVNMRNIARSINLVPRLLTIFFGTIMYYIINKVIYYLNGMSDLGRGELIRWEGVPERADQLTASLSRMFFEAETLSPISLKIFFLAILAIAITALVRMVFRHGFDKRTALDVAQVLFLLGLAILGIMAVNSVLIIWNGLPRHLFTACFFWAGTIAAGYILTQGRVRTIVKVLAVVILFSFIGINNRVYADQLRVNMRDILQANRILAKLESEPGFMQVRRVTMMHTAARPLPAVPTADGDLNRSALQIMWAQAMILNEITGYRYEEGTSEEKYFAYDYCARSGATPGSVKIFGELAVACY